MTRISTQGERLSRRQFLQGGTFVGCAAGFGSSAWSALALSRENEARRRFAPNDGLSLAEYIDREAPKMDVLPYYLLTDSDIRFRASLTFKRYLSFFRFKERVLSATKEEIDDCVRQIDVFSPKKKALILFATRLFNKVYRSLPKNDYQQRYYEWRESVKETTKSINLNYPTDLDNSEERSFSLGKRPYYPYSYPVLRARYLYRTLLILGKPNPDTFLDEERSLGWINVKKKFYNSKEIAFSALIEPPEDSRYKEIKETLLRLVKSPLRFLVCTDANWESTWERRDDLPEPLKVSSLIEWRLSLEEKGQLPARYEPRFDTDNFDRNLNFWIQWFKNIEDCVAIIRRELNLTISPERWISDYYPDSDAFLKKVAELEDDESAPYEKVELLVALREYWFSMQTGFDYDHFSDWFDPTMGTLANPFYDVLGADAVMLKDVALYI